MYIMHEIVTEMQILSITSTKCTFNSRVKNRKFPLRINCRLFFMYCAGYYLLVTNTDIKHDFHKNITMVYGDIAIEIYKQ